ncbi:MtnX-like HAD-IB family phosphatase [Bacillus sp. 2205SS5-2]|uniref:MtnX-like HAD-IB family phosphatase n=1 Tax=Bacillus sp. 2205SS5-2 TaxID=3109031 RepID=UPI003004307B
MKKWAFVSDFDGTISTKDFYWIIIEKYFPKGRELFQEWKAGKMKDIDFLSTVFTSIQQEEAKIIQDIHEIPIDPYVPDFIRNVQAEGADFFILSAGTDYYIHHLLQKYKISDVKVFSNEGRYSDQNVHLSIDPEHKHFSERYGIDKTKVIEELKEVYETVYFIGDSEPDSHPAKVADLTFAKDALQDLLRQNEVPFIAVDTFKEVESYLQKQGVLSR